LMVSSLVGCLSTQRLPIHADNVVIRGGNGSNADWIVPFPYLFSHFQNEYICKYEYCRIWI
jgi:hypothetical protein